MITIYKYQVFPEISGKISLDLPIRAKILKVDTQRETACIWAMVDDTYEKTETRNFEVYGTGHEMKEPVEDLNYIGTFFIQDKSFVFHLFERITKRQY
jgi:hypothetical protein